MSLVSRSKARNLAPQKTPSHTFQSLPLPVREPYLDLLYHRLAVLVFLTVYKWTYTVCTHLYPASSTQYNVCEIHPLLLVVVICSVSFLYIIPLCKYTSHLSILLLGGVWITSRLALSSIMLL